MNTITTGITRLTCLALFLPAVALAQFRSDPSPPALGIGVDTVPVAGWGDRWKSPVPAIFRRWAEFLGAKTTRYTAPSSAPSPYWSVAEQERWISFPLALNFVGTSAVPTVLDIRPAIPGSDSVYVVKTLFQSAGVGRGRQPLALTRVYAVRERGVWVFSNVLPRLTGTWQRKSVGSVDYVFPPGYPFDRARARRAAAFADSVTSAFAMPPLTHIVYYLTESPDEMNRIIGLDWYPSSTDGGGFSSGPNRLIVSGNPAVGEDYRHEIVHVALGPLALQGVHPLLWEGVATWLGGTLGMDARAVRAEYAEFLRHHKDITIDSVLNESRPYDQGYRPAGAVICQMVFDNGGNAAVKALLANGYTDTDLRVGLQRALGKPWTEIQADWRRRSLAP